MSRRKGKPTVSLAATNNIVVDILTPVYGQPDFVEQLMTTMFAYDAGVTWRWFVIDDKGPQSDHLTKVYDEMKRDSRCRVIPPTINRGFAGANNEAFFRGSAQYVLLLNSDTRIRHDGWLKTMTDEFLDPRVGIVGARLVYFEDSVGDARKRPGKTQHAGVAFNLIGQPYHIFMGWSPDHPQVNQRRRMGAVTGACLLTRRRLYHKFGGLDTDYGQGNFEDVQYCRQVVADGYRIIYTPAATLDHFAGGSDNTAHSVRNASLFQQKAGHLVTYDEWRYYAKNGPIYDD